MPDAAGGAGAGRDALDTNVLVYATAGAGPKRARAQELLAAGGTISAQSLNEAAHVLRRKAGLTIPEVEVALGAVRALLAVVPLTEAVHLRGLRIAAATGYSIWDASILAAAAEAGLSRLWSEDMQHGRTVEGVLIENPFADQGGLD